MSDTEWLEIAKQLEPHLKEIKQIVNNSEIQAMDITVSRLFDTLSCKTFLEAMYRIEFFQDKVAVSVTDLRRSGYHEEILN